MTSGPSGMLLLLLLFAELPRLFIRGTRPQTEQRLAYNKISVLVIIIYTCKGDNGKKSQCNTLKITTPVHKNQVKSLKLLHMMF